MKKIIISFFVLIGLIICANYYNNFAIKSYSFCSTDGNFSYTAIPSKGRTAENMKMTFEAYKRENEQRQSQILHRTFKVYYARVEKGYAYVPLKFHAEEASLTLEFQKQYKVSHLNNLIEQELNKRQRKKRKKARGDR